MAGNVAQECAGSTPSACCECTTRARLHHVAPGPFTAGRPETMPASGAVPRACAAAGTAAAQWPLGGLWAVLVPNLLNAVVGILAGGLVLAGVTLVQRLRGKSTAH